MAEINDTYGSIYQNLIDAGCDMQITEQCMGYIKKGNVSDMLPILMQYKATLLAAVHTGQQHRSN